MKTNDNQSKRIYDKTTKQWYEIPEDQYRDYDRWCTALRKRMQYRDECFCPRSKWWLCDGNCLDCEFHNNTTVSLDDPLPDGEGTLADYIPDGAPLIEEVLSEKTELDQLFERLQELMPEAKRIGELREEGLSDEAIIPKEIFMQAELVRRRKVHTGPNGQKRIYSGNNCFSQIVVCGECGELYRRVFQRIPVDLGEKRNPHLRSIHRSQFDLRRFTALACDIPAALDHIILIKLINRSGSRCDPAGPVIFSCICLHCVQEGIADRIQMTTSLRT